MRENTPVLPYLSHAELQARHAQLEPRQPVSGLLLLTPLHQAEDADDHVPRSRQHAEHDPEKEHNKKHHKNTL